MYRVIEQGDDVLLGGAGWGGLQEPDALREHGHQVGSRDGQADFHKDLLEPPPGAHAGGGGKGKGVGHE